MREVAIRSLENETEGQAEPALGNAGPLVAVEELDRHAVLPGGLAHGLEQLSGRPVAIDHHREVAADLRKTRDIAVAHFGGLQLPEGVEIDFEDRAGHLDLEVRRHLGVKLANRADHLASHRNHRRGPRVEVRRDPLALQDCHIT